MNSNDDKVGVETAATDASDLMMYLANRALNSETVDLKIPEFFVMVDVEECTKFREGDRPRCHTY